jgi:hypothetical protein
LRKRAEDIVGGYWEAWTSPQATALTQALETAAERADGIDDCLVRQWAPDFPSKPVLG